jgi:glycosyltransferase involved in cell wall biosynthesis
MRILLISGEFPPMQGGVGDYTREMARAFAALGHDAWVLVPSALETAHQDATSEPWHILARVDNWKWGCWQQIIDAVRRVKPDIIDLQYQAAAYHMRVPAVNLMPWRLRRASEHPPFVVTFHDLKPPYLFPKAGPLRRRAVQVLARCSDAAIVTNAEDLAEVLEWGFGRPAGAAACGSAPLGSAHPSFHHIPIGSNIAVQPPPGFRRAEWRKQRGYREDDFVWAYFGFLNQSKGGETLVRALAAAPAGTHLLMIGGRVGTSDPTNRSYAENVQGLMHELGVVDRVQWTGYVTAEQVSAALLSADVVVLPYRDGVSFRRGSLHAALAHGCAIVSTTPRVHLPELRQGGNVLLVPPDDPQSLVQAAERLRRDSALRGRIGEAAGELARHFTWDRIARRTVDEVLTPLTTASPAPE